MQLVKIQELVVASQEFIVAKDETGLFHTLRREWVSAGKLNCELNGIQTMCSDTLEGAIRMRTMDVEVRRIMSREKVDLMTAMRMYAEKHPWNKE